MRCSDFTNHNTSPSAMGVVIRLACARAKGEGVEVESLLRKAGLTRHQVDDPSTRELESLLRKAGLTRHQVDDLAAQRKKSDPIPRTRRSRTRG